MVSFIYKIRKDFFTVANIIDYINWRGDLSFDAAPFNDVDALVLSRLADAPFDGIVPESFDSRSDITVGGAAKRLLELTSGDAPERAFRMEEDAALMEALIGSERFAPLALTGFANRFDEEQEKQFSAVSILLPGEFFAAFRGTDGTLVGWKEDFNMGFEDTVPAQQDAVDYLEAAARSLKGKIRTGGHSKGGNLAVYSAAFASKRVQKRILRVCNNDGPGFSAQRIAQESFAAILPLVRTYIPQSSVVGMLLEHEEDFRVIHSTNSGLMQHDLYSWEVARTGFINVESVTNSSQFIDMTLKDWMMNMPADLREKMIDGVYSIFASCDARTLSELWTGKNTIAAASSTSEMPAEISTV